MLSLTTLFVIALVERHLIISLVLHQVRLRLLLRALLRGVTTHSASSWSSRLDCLLVRELHLKQLLLPALLLLLGQHGLTNVGDFTITTFCPHTFSCLSQYLLLQPLLRQKF